MIRQLTLKDFDKWKVLRIEAVKLNPESYGESLNDVLMHDINWFEAYLKRGQTFAYEKDGKMVGLIGSFLLQSENVKHRAEIAALYVKPEYRNNGIASMLINHIINLVKFTHKQIHLSVVSNNKAAEALYAKHGFVTYATIPDGLLIGNKFYDEYLMIRKL